MVTRIYRAIDLDNNFVFGSYLVGLDQNFIAIVNESGEINLTPVRLETVSQCTGLEDIHKVKIFENDKIKSGHGITYIITLMNGGFKAVNACGLAWDFERIYEPEKVGTLWM